MFVKLTKILLLSLLVVITLTYFILFLIRNGRGFIIQVDKNLTSSNIFLTLEEKGEEGKTRILKGQSVEYMDNISVNWIKKDVDTEALGSHNGDNYYAYTFYLVNGGTATINYWYSIHISETLLNLDEAIRVMVIKDGERKVYAKLNSKTNEPEEGTVAFFKNDMPTLEEVRDFKPGDRHRFTVVVWIEGDDPDCNNELIGGGIKMNMEITEERIER